MRTIGWDTPISGPICQKTAKGDRTYKLRFGATPEYGRYVKYPYGALQWDVSNVREG